MHSPSDDLNQKSSHSSSDLFSDSDKHEREEINDEEENKDQV